MASLSRLDRGLSRLAVGSIRVLAVLLVVVAFAGGGGVTAASVSSAHETAGQADAEDADGPATTDDPGTAANPGNPGRSCPGENPNVGLEHADESGQKNSKKGITTAFHAIGCGDE